LTHLPKSYQSALQPAFDVRAVRDRTYKTPVWVHFGAGNIFRGYIAMLQDRLLGSGYTDKGVIAAEVFDYEIISAVLRPCDNQTLVVTLRSDGTVKLDVSASVTEALAAVPGSSDYMRLEAVMAAESLQMASFTITEKGYRGPAMDLLAGLMFKRYQSGAAPLALVSMDNCSSNGDVLRSAVLQAARVFENDGFTAYLSDPERVFFPWSMIDKITPAPSAGARKHLPPGVQTDIVITAKGTAAAPFVNAEEPGYLVIEDKFPNGRPPLEKAGVFFAGRDTVRKAERMKVTACLNPLHTALAVFGSLLRIESVADCMKVVELAELARRVGYDEGLPATEHPGIFEPRDYLDEVFSKRLTNPFLPDTTARIAADTSLKIAFRFGETVKTYAARDDLRTEDLHTIPLVIAGWARYLLAVGDDGKALVISPDPKLPELMEALKDVRFGEPASAVNARPVFADTEIFGCDLYAEGLGMRCEEYLAAMLAGRGAVRNILVRSIDFYC
jgi:fructuronate reductase